MHSRELTTGRTFGVRFDAGESFFPALEELCRSNGIRCGYIPMFLAAFAEADIVGTCDRLDDPAAPVWSKVHLANAEAHGCGTIAYDEREGRIVPHVHTTLGLKEHSATGYTSHLLAARVQFLVEMIMVEVTSPAMTRPPNPGLYDVPLLTFGDRGLLCSGPSAPSAVPGLSLDRYRERRSNVPGALRGQCLGRSAPDEAPAFSAGQAGQLTFLLHCWRAQGAGRIPGPGTGGLSASGHIAGGQV